MTIKEQIELDLAKAFPGSAADITISSSSVAGIDYQCNACFALARELGKNPLELAESVAKSFKSKIATVTVSKPAFLNFVVNDDALVKMASKVLKTKKLKLPKQKQRTIFVDYGGANVGKELHIGHLRTPIVGEAVRRVFNAFGHKTIGDTFLGDWGLQFGLIIAELELLGDPTKMTVTLDMLNEVYPRASKRKETDKKFYARAEEITANLQRMEEPYLTLWKGIRETSVARIRENYLRLNCTFDTYNGESHAQPYLDMVLDSMTMRGVTYMDAGCLMIDVRQEGEHVPIPKKTPDEPQHYLRPMPPVILKKGNGGHLYLTSDLATMYYRNRDFKPDEFIHVVDARQGMHFIQLFRIAKKGGIIPAETKTVHVGIGTINGPDGKPFKTRAGGTVKLEEVMDTVVEFAKRKMVESGRAASDDVAERVGLSALKFADLSNNVRRDYIFDLEKFTDFNGKTGPYLLYTVARINSIFERADAADLKLGTENRAVLAAIMKLVDSYTIALTNYTLNALCDAVYDLAQEFNNFYATTNILRETDKTKRNSYLALCAVTKSAIEFALNTLAIDTVERM